MPDQPPQPKEKRRYPRLCVRVKVTYTDGKRRREAMLRDVSEGGAFVSTDQPPPVGTPLKLSLAVPGEEVSDGEIEGRVVRVVEMDGDPIPDHITGMGIEFKLTPEQRERLRAVLTRHGSGQINPESDT